MKKAYPWFIYNTTADISRYLVESRGGCRIYAWMMRHGASRRWCDNITLLNVQQGKPHDSSMAPGNGGVGGGGYYGGGVAAPVTLPLDPPMANIHGQSFHTKIVFLF